MPEQAQIESDLAGFIEREILGGSRQVTPDTDLIAAGLDSLSLVSLLLFIEREYGKWIPQNEITEEMLKNTRNLAQTIVKYLRD